MEHENAIRNDSTATALLGHSPDDAGTTRARRAEKRKIGAALRGITPQHRATLLTAEEVRALTDGLLHDMRSTHERTLDACADRVLKRLDAEAD